MPRQVLAKDPDQSSRNGGQTTLMKFLRPRVVPEVATSLEVSHGRDTAGISCRRQVVSTRLVGDSSDEDELDSLNQVLPQLSRAGRRFVTSNSPKKRHKTAGKQEPDSPPPKLPNYSGLFNLQALLADRVDRNNEKQIIAKLDGDSVETGESEVASERVSTRTIGYTSDPARLNSLLKANHSDNQSYFSVSAVGPSDAKFVPTAAEMKVLFTGLPASLQISTELQFLGLLSSGRALTYMNLRGWDQLPPGLTHHILHVLAQTNDPRAIANIGAILDQSPEFDLVDLSRMSCYLGLNGLLTGDKSLSESQLTLKLVPPLDHLRRLKMVQILQFLARTINHVRKREQVDHATNVYCHRLLILLLLLSQDSAYGHHLVEEIETLLIPLCTQLSTTTPIPRLLTSLARFTPAMQVRLITAIPTTTRETLEYSQRAASDAFLGSKSMDVVDQRLAKFIEHLSSNRPFFPLDESTSYSDLCQKIVLLSLATSSISAKSSVQVTRLVERLQHLHGQIVDSKAAFIDRSEAKAAIQRLADRLKYTLESRSRKGNVFERFRN